MMADVKLCVTETRFYECTLQKEELLRIFNDANALAHRLPADAEVTITVPSGGDYSGDTLQLDEAGGLTISWRETKSS